MYTRKQLILYCVSTLAVSSVLVVAFAGTAYYGRVKRSLAARAGYDRITLDRNLDLTTQQQKEIVALFQQLKAFNKPYWLGIETMQTPFDLWLIQEIIHEVKPDYVIETGTYRGGTALYYAHMLEGMDLQDSRVFTVDITRKNVDASGVEQKALWQRNVEFLVGSSTSPDIVKRIAETVMDQNVVVILDSDHSYEHVSKELLLYGPLVSPGSYLIVQDTQFVSPMQAVEDFLQTEEGSAFSRDYSRDTWVLTSSPGGWLKKRGP